MATDTETRTAPRPVQDTNAAKEKVRHNKKINLNTATKEELMGISPQIGIERAESIIKYRDVIGPFESVEDVLKIPSFGVKLMFFFRNFSEV